MPPKSKELIKQQKIWYDKLKATGFDDIEQDEDKLKKWTSDKFSRRPEWDKSKEEYYRAAGHFLHDYKFETKLDRDIWELHQSGMAIREICQVLRTRKIKTFKSIVHRTIQRLAAEMKRVCLS